MSETLLFLIPAPLAGQDPAFKIYWYQSIDGLSWADPFVDSILVSDLPIENGKYKWESSLVDPAKFHQIKTESVSGVKSQSGFIIPPRPEVSNVTENDLGYATRLSDGTNSYDIGTDVELMLELDISVVDTIGSIIPIQILDPFNNVIGELTAIAIAPTIYVATYTIPKNLSKLYNPAKNQEYSNDPGFYVLTDRWLLADGGVLDYNILVKRDSLEVPITDNAIIEVKLEGITSIDEHTLEEDIIKFSTKLTPYYCSVDDVRSTNKEFLSDFDNFEIAQEIMIYSKEIDLTLRPNVIKRKAQYDYAAIQYATYMTSYSLISAGSFNNLSEDKEIDTFKISVTRNEKSNVLKHILDYIKEYEAVLLAGGMDNLFQSKTFVKGIFDPNRTNLSRATYDNTDSLPYLNKTTQAYAMAMEDGSVQEVRGTHTVGYIGLRANGGYGAANYNPSGGSNFNLTEVSFGEAWNHD